MFTLTVISTELFHFSVISTERSEWRNPYEDVSTTLDMTSVNWYITSIIFNLTTINLIWFNLKQIRIVCHKFYGNDIHIYTTFHLNQTFYTLRHSEPHSVIHNPSVILNPTLSSWTKWRISIRSFGGVVSGRKSVKKWPVTTWNHSISILSCSVRSENSIKRPGHYMET